MTKLSVNINKIATIRNARGGNIPDLVLAATNIENYGGQGITVHPRPDERHIRYSDVHELKKVLKTELNIEGYPSQKFVDLVLKIIPSQVTLVPDPPDAITSNQGWNTKKYCTLLTDLVSEFKKNGIRTSIFVDPTELLIDFAAKTGTDRVELYTEPYASMFNIDKFKAVEAFILAANRAKLNSIEINAGHDLNLQNLNFFIKSIPEISEVSIGHALISDALYYGLQNTVQMYLKQLVL